MNKSGKRSFYRKLEKILLQLLEKKVAELDMSLTGEKAHYCAGYVGRPIRSGKTILKINNICLEVRASEKGHKIPHFHITVRGQGDAAYAIDTFERIKGEIPAKTEKKILEWAKENKNIIKTTWNLFHQDIRCE